MYASNWVLALTSAVCLSACMGVGPTITTARFTNETYTPTKAIQVAVITNSKSIQKPFLEIGLIDAEEGPGSQSYDEIITATKIKAAEMGADAVIISTDSKSQGMIAYGGMLIPINGKQVKAVAIRWSNK